MDYWQAIALMASAGLGCSVAAFGLVLFAPEQVAAVTRYRRAL